jgi:FixJ family two-component response regulator
VSPIQQQQQRAGSEQCRACGFRHGKTGHDVNLGTENAPGLMRLLKESHPGVPILLYSGLEENDLAVQTMMKEGARHYLRKGPMTEFLDGVRTTLQQKRVKALHRPINWFNGSNLSSPVAFLPLAC